MDFTAGIEERVNRPLSRDRLAFSYGAGAWEFEYAGYADLIEITFEVVS